MFNFLKKKKEEKKEEKIGVGFSHVEIACFPDCHFCGVKVVPEKYNVIPFSVISAETGESCAVCKDCATLRDLKSQLGRCKNCASAYQPKPPCSACKARIKKHTVQWDSYDKIYGRGKSKIDKMKFEIRKEEEKFELLKRNLAEKGRIIIERGQVK